MAGNKKKSNLIFIITAMALILIGAIVARFVGGFRFFKILLVFALLFVILTVAVDILTILIKNKRSTPKKEKSITVRSNGTIYNIDRSKLKNVNSDVNEVEKEDCSKEKQYETVKKEKTFTFETGNSEKYRTTESKKRDVSEYIGLNPFSDGEKQEEVKNVTKDVIKEEVIEEVIEEVKQDVKKDFVNENSFAKADSEEKIVSKDTEIEEKPGFTFSTFSFKTPEPETKEKQNEFSVLNNIEEIKEEVASEKVQEEDQNDIPEAQGTVINEVVNNENANKEELNETVQEEITEEVKEELKEEKDVKEEKQEEPQKNDFGKGNPVREKMEQLVLGKDDDGNVVRLMPIDEIETETKELSENIKSTLENVGRRKIIFRTTDRTGKKTRETDPFADRPESRPKLYDSDVSESSNSEDDRVPPYFNENTYKENTYKENTYKKPVVQEETRPVSKAFEGFENKTFYHDSKREDHVVADEKKLSALFGNRETTKHVQYEEPTEEPEEDFEEEQDILEEQNDKFDYSKRNGAFRDLDEEPEESPVKRAQQAEDQRTLKNEISYSDKMVQNAAPVNAPVKKTIPYVVPKVDILADHRIEGRDPDKDNDIIQENANKLLSTLSSFGIEAKIINAQRGPSVTRYELQPEPGVKVSRILSLSDDIALSLAAAGIRFEAPIPGKSAIGIEVPNKSTDIVFLKDVLKSPEYANSQSKLSVGLGRDIAGNAVVGDISKFPHVLIAGSTGSGKSVCINTIITSILFKASPDEVKFIMIDPKVVELGIYNGLPHLLVPVVTNPKKAAAALNWAVNDMEDRYTKFAESRVRDIKGYNAMHPEDKMPSIVIIIDELADLMMTSGKEVEDAIIRLAQKARAAGVYLIIATQRPSVDVITGLIKANVPSRIAFAVSSYVDSRTILDSAGAEKLLGRGDMLYHPTGMIKPKRVQGAFVSDEEVETVVNEIRNNCGEAVYNQSVLEALERPSGEKPAAGGNGAPKSEEEDVDHALIVEAGDIAVKFGQLSTSFIQRKFKVGFARAGRIVDVLEEKGIVSAAEGSKPRNTLVTEAEWKQIRENI